MSYVNCKLCPRECGVDRTNGKTGEARLTIATDQTEPVVLIFKTTAEETSLA